MTSGKEIVSTLRKMERKLKRGWTQGAFAVDKHENRVDYKASKPTSEMSVIEIRKLVLGDEYMTDFNDSHTKEEVLDVVHKAINKARRLYHV